MVLLLNTGSIAYRFFGPLDLVIRIMGGSLNWLLNWTGFGGVIITGGLAVAAHGVEDDSESAAHCRVSFFRI